VDPSGRGRDVRLPAGGLRPPRLRHAKTCRQFDFLVGLLRTRRFAVTCLQNIVDVDAETISRACELRIGASEPARTHERAYLYDMRALRNDSVDVYARVSEYIDQVISWIERLRSRRSRPRLPPPERVPPDHRLSPFP
jgi:cysteinyl-tRNA synthetase